MRLLLSRFDGWICGGKYAFDDWVDVDDGRDRSVADSGNREEEEEEEEDEEEDEEAFICDPVVKFGMSRVRDGEVRCRAGSMGEAPNVTGATVEAVVRIGEEAMEAS